MLKFFIIPLFGATFIAIVWNTAMPYIDTAAQTVNLVAKVTAKR